MTLWSPLHGLFLHFPPERITLQTILRLSMATGNLALLWDSISGREVGSLLITTYRSDHVDVAIGMKMALASRFPLSKGIGPLKYSWISGLSCESSIRAMVT